MAGDSISMMCPVSPTLNLTEMILQRVTLSHSDILQIATNCPQLSKLSIYKSKPTYQGLQSIRDQFREEGDDLILRQKGKVFQHLKDFIWTRDEPNRPFYRSRFVRSDHGQYLGKALLNFILQNAAQTLTHLVLQIPADGNVPSDSPSELILQNIFKRPFPFLYSVDLMFLYTNNMVNIAETLLQNARLLQRASIYQVRSRQNVYYPCRVMMSPETL